jgi:hypothetical protein
VKKPTLLSVLNRRLGAESGFFFCGGFWGFGKRKTRREERFFSVFFGLEREAVAKRFSAAARVAVRVVALRHVKDETAAGNLNRVRREEGAGAGGTFCLQHLHEDRVAGPRAEDVAHRARQSGQQTDVCQADLWAEAGHQQRRGVGLRHARKLSAAPHEDGADVLLHGEPSLYLSIADGGRARVLGDQPLLCGDAAEEGRASRRGRRAAGKSLVDHWESRAPRGSRRSARGRGRAGERGKRRHHRPRSLRHDADIPARVLCVQAVAPRELLLVEAGLDEKLGRHAAETERVEVPRGEGPQPGGPARGVLCLSAPQMLLWRGLGRLGLRVAEPGLKKALLEQVL